MFLHVIVNNIIYIFITYNRNRRIVETKIILTVKVFYVSKIVAIVQVSSMHNNYKKFKCTFSGDNII